MKSTYFSFLLLIFLFIGCNSQTEQKKSETYIYKNQHNELISLDLNGTSFTLSWVIIETKKSEQLNIFGLIQYSGEVMLIDNKKKLQLIEMTKNSLKISDGKTISAPIDSGPNFKFNNKTKQINFNGELLSVNSDYSIHKIHKLISIHDNWSGIEIKLGDLKSNY